MKSLSDDTHKDGTFRGQADDGAKRLHERLGAYSRESPPSSNGPTIEEPVTPELALVDPELARRAREQLPEPAAEAPRPPRARASTPGDALPADTRPGSRSERRPRRKRRLVGWMLAVTLLGAAAGLALASRTSLHEFVSDRAPDRIGPLGDRSSPAEPPGSRSSQAHPQPQSPSAGPPTATRTRETVPTGNRPIAPTPPGPPRLAVPAERKFVWVPTPGAASYLVQLYRGQKEIFRAQRTAPSIVVPAEWSSKGRKYRLVPGPYRWSVRPRLRGSRTYGSPVVKATLVVQPDSPDESSGRR